MIHLFMKKMGDLAEPVKLVVGDVTYNYPEDKLFEKLESYLNYKIQVTYDNKEPKNYVIKSVSLDGIPTLELT